MHKFLKDREVKQYVHSKGKQLDKSFLPWLSDKVMNIINESIHMSGSRKRIESGIRSGR